MASTIVPGCAQSVDDALWEGINPERQKEILFSCATTPSSTDRLDTDMLRLHHKIVRWTF